MTPLFGLLTLQALGLLTLQAHNASTQMDGFQQIEWGEPPALRPNQQPNHPAPLSYFSVLFMRRASLPSFPPSLARLNDENFNFQ